MPAGRPRANDDLYEEIRSRIGNGEPRRTVVEDVARRHAKNPKSLNSQFSVWLNSRLPSVISAPNLRLVSIASLVEARSQLETILAQAERQLAESERILAEMSAGREALAEHVESIQEVLAAVRGRPSQGGND